MASPAELLEKAKNTATASVTQEKIIKSRGTVQGAVAGAVAGGMIGYYKNYNIYASVIVGILAGGIISHTFITVKNEG